MLKNLKAKKRSLKFYKNRVIGSDRGISIILAIIIIIMLGLAGSIFAYLMASGSITSRSNLLSAEAKYAAKSGVEITLYKIENGGASAFSNGQPPQGCLTTPVRPPGVSGTLSNIRYLSGNLQGNPSTLPSNLNYTPTFCAVEGKLSGSGSGNCAYYIVTSNGFAGGTEREITAEVGIHNGHGHGHGNCTGIYVETELPNSN